MERGPTGPATELPGAGPAGGWDLGTAQSSSLGRMDLPVNDVTGAAWWRDHPTGLQEGKAGDTSTAAGGTGGQRAWPRGCTRGAPRKVAGCREEAGAAGIAVLACLHCAREQSSGDPPILLTPLIRLKLKPWRGLSCSAPLLHSYVRPVRGTRGSRTRLPGSAGTCPPVVFRARHKGAHGSAYR